MTMLDENLATSITKMKRSYWTTPGIGREYQYMAHEPAPITRMKNLSEIGLVLRGVAGPRVLDAGAGTGRFTLPLQSQGVHAVPLDISREMLGEGVKRARETGAAFPAIQGDIEALPFPDESFDSVVSITVLRHFPGWRDIVLEYARVAKPGGRILFDMGSGDQAALLAEMGVPEAPQDAFGYNARISLADLHQFARRANLRVASVCPYDFFNENRLLERAMGAEFKARIDDIVSELGHTEAVVLYEFLSRSFLSLCGPAMTSSIFVVLEKTDYAAVPEAESSTMAATPEETIAIAFRQWLGSDFEPACAVLGQILEAEPAARFMAALVQHVLPVFPVQALTYRASSSIEETI